MSEVRENGPEDDPGTDPLYDAAMQQRMDDWAAMGPPLVNKPIDKVGNQARTVPEDIVTHREMRQNLPGYFLLD